MVASPGCKKAAEKAPAAAAGAAAPAEAAPKSVAPTGASNEATTQAAPDGLCFDRAACEAACRAGNGHACARWGRLLSGGWNGEPTSGQPAWEAGCTLGEPWSCLALLGEVTGPAAARALERAVTVTTKGCAAGGAEACMYRAALVAHGAADEVRSSGKVQREKRRWAVLACQAGHATACDVASLMDGMAPETEGDGADLEPPPKKALALCRAGEQNVCASLIAAEDAQSEAAYAVVVDHCARGWAPACYTAGKGIADAEPEAAAAHFKAGCAAGDAPSCARADEDDPFWNGDFDVTTWEVGVADCETLRPSAEHPKRLHLEVADQTLHVTLCPDGTCDDEPKWQLGERARTQWTAGDAYSGTSDSETCTVERPAYQANREGALLTLTLVEERGTTAVSEAPCSPAAIAATAFKCTSKTRIAARLAP